MKFSLRKWIATRLAKFKLTRAFLWADQYGLTVVKVERRAGTDYIVHRDGSFNKLGKKEAK